MNPCSKYGPRLYLSRVVIIYCGLCWCLFINTQESYNVSLHSFPSCVFFFFPVVLVNIPCMINFQAKYLFLGVHTSDLNSIPVFLYFPTPFQARWELTGKLYQLNVYLCINVWTSIITPASFRTEYTWLMKQNSTFRAVQ